MRARINGFEMVYEVSGPAGAPAIVLHHPLATTQGGWDHLTAVLSPRFRVVRFDARGHGASEATPAPYDFDMLAADVVALMDHLGIARAHFLGLSMGGFVGQVLGTKHADRFSALTLVSTSSRMPPESRPLWEARVVGARAHGMASQTETALARWVAPEALKNDAALVARCVAMIEATPVEGYAGWCSAIATLDLTDTLKMIRLPTRIVVGALDPATPIAAAEVLHREIPGSGLVIVPGVSHMLHLEAPEVFAATVVPFLELHPA